MSSVEAQICSPPRKETCQLLEKMLQPELYDKVSQPIRKETQRVLDKYLHLVQGKIKDDQVVLDIGCGIGDATTKALLPALPPTTKIVAGDILSKMVYYAEANYPHDNVKYTILDISQEPSPEAPKFDHAFSFFCFHYLRDYKQALQNLHSLLNVGGTIFLTFITENPFASSYEVMGKQEQWKPYMKDSREHTILYHNVPNPEEDFRKLLETTNFEVHVCEVEETGLVYPNMDLFKDYLRVFNPFLERMPKNLQGEYFDEFVEHWRSNERFPKMLCNSAKEIVAKLNLMVVVATKRA